MIQHAWSVLCERAITDKDTNNISLIYCIEQITTIRLPLQFPQITFSTLWYKTDQKDTNPYDLSLKFFVEKPNQEKELIGETRAKIEKPRHRFNFSIGGFLFSHEGTYLFSVEYNLENQGWKKTNQIPLQVIYQPPQSEIKLSN